MSITFTVICPIHNEESMLPYSLPSVYRLRPNEVILILDRCTDSSRRICEIASSHYPKTRTRLVDVDNSTVEGWASRIGAIRRHAFSISSSDAILNTDADIVLDAKIGDYMKELKSSVRMIKFGFMDYPFNPQSFVKKIMSGFSSLPSIVKGYAGLYCFSKEAWQMSEAPASAQIAEAEDSHLQVSISQRYQVLYKNTGSLHLRPAETKEKNFWRGMEYYRTVKASTIMVLLHSFVMLRPHMLSGYLYAMNVDTGHGRIQSEKPL